MILIMSSESEFSPEYDIFSCPFMRQCHLPKHHFICNNSGFRTCTEYVLRFDRLRAQNMLY